MKLRGICRWRIRSGLKSLIFLPLALAPSALSALGADDISGHYYLSGIMEVGSELLLTRDGRFQWMLAYGAMDKQAEGHWTSDGKVLTLTSRVPSFEGVTFRLAERSAWNERATSALARYRKNLTIARQRLECPLASLSGEVVDDPAVEYGDSKPPASRITEQASATDHARKAAQMALDRLKAHPGWKDNPVLVGQADHAVADFMAAQKMLIGLRDLAGIEPNLPQDLDLPVECRWADWQKEAASFRGVAIGVFDHEHQQPGDGIQIEVRYNRGPPVAAMIEEGVAFFPLAEGQKIVALSLHVPGASKEKATTFSVSLDRASIQAIDADLGATIRPAFASMRLQVNPDGSLSPLEMLSRGTYRKAVIVPPAVPGVSSEKDDRPTSSAQGACDSHAWEAEIGRRVKQAVRYPPEAYARKIEGKAIVRINIDRHGAVSFAAIEQSSGSDLLDEAAIRAVQTVGTLVVPPCGSIGVKARIPVAFAIAE